MRLSPRSWPAGVGFATIAAALVIVGAAVHLWTDAARHAAPWTGSDNALILFIAEEMDAGASLYVDWQDPDTPSIFFFSLGAVHLARTGIHVVLAYNLLVFAVAAAGLIVLVRSLVRMERPWPVVALTTAGYLCLLMKPGTITRDFGQREHLFALLLIPELFALVSPGRFAGRPVWCAALAFMAMIKPQFTVMLALLELSALRSSRPTAADAAGFLAGAVAPFALLWWHSAESFQALFTEALALHLSGAYAVLNATPAALLNRWPLFVLGVATSAALLMAAVARQDRRLRGLSGRGVLLFVAAAAAVVHQQKYFPYHFLPLFGLAAVCGAWAAGEWLARGRHSLLAGLAASVVITGSAAAFHLDVRSNGDPLAVRLGESVEAPADMLVVSVYAHGLCTPYRGAPRCVGPELQSPRLAMMARADDAAIRLEAWAGEVAARVGEKRPELLALSVSEAALPAGVTPASLLLERFPVAAPGEYVPLTPDVERSVEARGWVILRRHDVMERPLRSRP